MRKEELDRIAKQRPFQPFEARLVDGQKFRFKSPEEFIISRSTIVTLDDKGDLFLINLGLISTAQVLNGNGTRKRS